MHLRLVVLVLITCVIPENHRLYRVRLGVWVFLPRCRKVSQGGLGRAGWREEGVHCMHGSFLLGLFYFLCGGARLLFLCEGREGLEARMLKKVLFWMILSLNMASFIFICEEERLIITFSSFSDAKSWRRRCRIMAGVSFITYIPFIVLVAIFAWRLLSFNARSACLSAARFRLLVRHPTLLCSSSPAQSFSPPAYLSLDFNYNHNRQPQFCPFLFPSLTIALNGLHDHSFSPSFFSDPRQSFLLPRITKKKHAFVTLPYSRCLFISSVCNDQFQFFMWGSYIILHTSQVMDNLSPFLMLSIWRREVGSER